MKYEYYVLAFSKFTYIKDIKLLYLIWNINFYVSWLITYLNNSKKSKIKNIIIYISLNQI